MDETGVERTNEANDDGDDFWSNLDSASRLWRTIRVTMKLGSYQSALVLKPNLTNSSHRSISNSSNGRDILKATTTYLFKQSSVNGGGREFFVEDSLEVMGLDPEDVEAFGINQIAALRILGRPWRSIVRRTDG